jgi:serine/threonine protein kinase
MGFGSSHRKRARKTRELLEPGRVVADRYRVRARLGGGGMGAVYEVEHLRTHRTLAMKVLIPELAKYPEVVQRLLAEARAAAAISHPAIVQIVDLDTDGDLNFIVMEKLEGEDLADRIRREAPLPLRFVVTMGAGIADAMSAAHRHSPKIIHRDLKPENIFLARQGGKRDVVKILDFGIAKLVEQENLEHSLTHTGDVFGTPLYMSPEQLRNSRDVDERTDVYAIGAILYECLTGKRPFQGESFPDLVVRISTESPIPIQQLRPEVPPALAAVIERAMAPRREDRIPSASELGVQLLRCLVSAQPLPGQRSIRPREVRPREVRPRGAVAAFTPNPGPQRPATKVRESRFYHWLVRWRRPLAAAASATVLALVAVFALLGRAGNLVIDVVPADAVVQLDGIVLRGPAPIPVERSPGSYRVTLTKEGYERLERVVRVRAGQDQRISVQLEPAPDTGFELHSVPPGQLVWLDGQPFTGSEPHGRQARTNFRASRVAPVRHLLEIKGDPRFLPWRYEFFQEPARILSIRARLIRAGGAGKARPTLVRRR